MRQSVLLAMKFHANLIFVLTVSVTSAMGWYLPNAEVVNINDASIRSPRDQTRTQLQTDEKYLTEENAAANRWMLLGQRPAIDLDDISYESKPLHIREKPRSFVGKAELEKLMNDGKFNPNFFHFRVTRSAAAPKTDSSQN